MKLDIIDDSDPAKEFDDIMNNNQMALLGREAIYSCFGDNKKYLEWGSGGSTLWYIEQTIKNKINTQIISVEHDMSWYSKVEHTVNNYIAPTKDQFLYLYKTAPWASVTFNNNIGFNVISTPFEETSAGLADYINPPEINISDIDVFLVDGLARGACLATIKTLIKKDAVVFLHDIQGREIWYQWALNLWSDYKTEYVYHNLIKLVPND